MVILRLFAKGCRRVAIEMREVAVAESANN
jgi:hypothetical protein